MEITQKLDSGNIKLKEKRIIFLSSEFPPGPGGIGTHAYQIARFLHNQGLIVTVLSPQDHVNDESIEKYNCDQPFEIVRLEPKKVRILSIIHKLNKIIATINQFHPDLIIASGVRAAQIIGLLSVVFHVPWIAVGHGSEFGHKRSLKTFFTRFVFNKANAIISVGKYTQKAMENIGIKNPVNTIIHNGADQNQFFRLTSQEIDQFRKDNYVQKKFVLLTVGSVTDRKGQEVVIRALPKMLERNPNIVYWMAGLPQELDKLTQLAEELNVRQSLKFWGTVSNDDLVKLYNTCDLFVMTSRQLADGDFEGFGIAVIEAALCGRTAVVSGDSGLEEAVHNGITGCVIPQNDPEELAKIVFQLASDNLILEEFSQNAYNNALNNQTWDKVGVQYLKLVEKVLLNCGN